MIELSKRKWRGRNTLCVGDCLKSTPVTCSHLRSYTVLCRSVMFCLLNNCIQLYSTVYSIVISIFSFFFSYFCFSLYFFVFHCHVFVFGSALGSLWRSRRSVTQGGDQGTSSGAEMKHKFQKWRELQHENHENNKHKQTCKLLQTVTRIKTTDHCLEHEK